MCEMNYVKDDGFFMCCHIHIKKRTYWYIGVDDNPNVWNLFLIIVL